MYPGSTHLRSVRLATAPDQTVWQYAAANDFAVVSKDDDFRQLSILRGAPPKVIRLQVGNSSTSLIVELLRRRFPAIESFLRDDEASFLIVPKDAV